MPYRKVFTLDLATSIGKLPTKTLRRSRSCEVSPSGTNFGNLLACLRFRLEVLVKASCTSSPSLSSSSDALPSSDEIFVVEGPASGDAGAGAGVSSS